jgi:hypothetical protein
MHRLIIFGVLLCFGVLPAAGRDVYTASFTELAVGARQQAMGGAGGVLGGEPSVFFWNPAGISSCRKKNVQLMHNWLFDGISYHDYAGGVVPLPGNAALGCHLVYLGIDDIPVFPDFTELGITDGNPSEINEYIKRTAAADLSSSSFSYSDLMGVVTFSQYYEKKLDLGWQYFIVPVEIPWGVNLKWLHSRMGSYGTASGIGIDAGAQVKVDGTKVVTENSYLGMFLAGITFQDITNTSIKWSSGHTSNLYYNIKFSLGYEQPLRFLAGKLVCVYDHNTKYSDSHWGLEYTYQDRAAVRIGSDRGYFTTGAGLTIKGVTLDYAFNMGDFANAHRLCGRFAW